nr:hypothetical protein [uncultured Cohaesibacter sp.]
MSKTARRAFDDATTSEGEIALFVFDHETLDTPLRLSTDPTERISSDPLIYGTRSTWDGANPISEPYLFVLMSAEIPGDQEDVPAAITIVLENVDNDIAALLRSFTNFATVHMAVVLASSKNYVEVEYRDLMLLSADGDAGEVHLSIGRRPIEDMSAPMDRFTPHRFPGLYR